MNKSIALAPAKPDDITRLFGQQPADQTLQKIFALVLAED